MIKIQVKAANISLTPAISDYVEKKISTLSKFIDPSDSSPMADIILKKTTHHHRDGEELFCAEGNLHVGSMHFHAESSNKDLYAAIDDVKDELHRELTSKKQRSTTLMRRGGAIIKNILKGFSK